MGAFLGAGLVSVTCQSLCVNWQEGAHELSLLHQSLWRFSLIINRRQVYSHRDQFISQSKRFSHLYLGKTLNNWRFWLAGMKILDNWSGPYSLLLVNQTTGDSQSNIACLPACLSFLHWRWSCIFLSPTLWIWKALTVRMVIMFTDRALIAKLHLIIWECGIAFWFQ